MQTHAVGLDELHAYSPASHLLNNLSGPHTDCQVTTCLCSSCSLKFLSGETEITDILTWTSAACGWKRDRVPVQTLPVSRIHRGHRSAACHRERCKREFRVQRILLWNGEKKCEPLLGGKKRNTPESSENVKRMTFSSGPFRARRAWSFWNAHNDIYNNLFLWLFRKKG